MKRGILVIIMMISTFGLYSFKMDAAKDAKTSFASYYHDKFNGRKTANGEIFSNAKMTAANLRLPFGTKVKITNIRNNKSVVVRINDRGPFCKDRSFDLSRAAFKAIGNESAGTLPIAYEIVD